uniref:Uncharacterized protein n=1 Tax=Kalanchoe fedtschenkoi TaxID=63787 RepID=A0A7N0VDJ0_KALFE
MSALTAKTIYNGILAQPPVVKFENQRDGRTSVSRSQPVLPYGDRRQAILSGGTRYPTLICSLSRSLPVEIGPEALPYGGWRLATAYTKVKRDGLICFAALVRHGLISMLHVVVLFKSRRQYEILVLLLSIKNLFIQTDG